MTTDPSDILVAPSDIAELAQVTRAAVSNWRKRDGLDFPNAVSGTASRPLFSRADVVSWLEKHGKVVREASERELWEAGNALRGTLPIDQVAHLMATLATLRVLSEDGNDGAWESLVAEGRHTTQHLAAAAARIPQDQQDLVDFSWLQEQQAPLTAAVMAVAGIPRAKLASAVDLMLDRTMSSQLYRSAEHGAVSSDATRLLTELAVEHLPRGGVIHDPACGIGGVIVEALLRARSVAGTAYEIDQEMAIRARQRAVIAGVSKRLDVIVTDTMHQDPRRDVRSDVVVVEPPFGMRAELSPLDPRWPVRVPPVAADLAWVFHSISHLGPDGNAFALLVPTLLRSPAARGLRALLVEAGHVEAIALLPKRVTQHTSISLSLWVLRPAGVAKETVTFIDAQNSKDPARDVPLWLRGGEIDAPHARVPIASVLANDANLDPVAWIAWNPPASSEELEEIVASNFRILEKISSTTSALAGDLQMAEKPDVLRTMTVADLIGAGWVTMTAGRAHSASSPLSQDDAGVIRATDVRADNIAELPTASTTGRVTRAGDVVVVTLGKVVAAIDPTGGHLLGPEIRALSVEPTAPIDSAYLALMLTGSWNERFNSGTIPRANLRDLEVPVAPYETQQQIVDQLSRLKKIRDNVAAMDTAALSSVDAILNLVRQSA